MRRAVRRRRTAGGPAPATAPGAAGMRQPPPHRAPLDRLRRTLARTALHTVGRTSKGVRTGFRHGFASGTMLDYVYADRAEGLFGIGRLIDRGYLDAADWRAVRARSALLKRMLCEEIAVRGGEVVVLDVASGPARYLQDLLAEDQPGSQLRVVCRDVAAPCLARGRRLARERGLPEGAISYEPGDAFDPAPLPGGRGADIVVVSGLYELTADDAMVRASLARLRTLLAPGGALLFTNRVGPPRRDSVADVLPGVAERCRPVSEVEGWAVRAGFPAASVVSRGEEVGLFTVTRCG